MMRVASNSRQMEAGIDHPNDLGGEFMSMMRDIEMGTAHTVINVSMSCAVIRASRLVRNSYVLCKWAQLLKRAKQHQKPFLDCNVYTLPQKRKCFWCDDVKQQ